MRWPHSGHGRGRLLSADCDCTTPNVMTWLVVAVGDACDPWQAAG
jgi:hypothetical protein